MERLVGVIPSDWIQCNDGNGGNISGRTITSPLPFLVISSCVLFTSAVGSPRGCGVHRHAGYLDGSVGTTRARMLRFSLPTSQSFTRLHTYAHP